MTSEAFLESPAVLSWISQFEPGDQPLAMALVRAIRLVSSDDFVRGIRARLLETSEGVNGAVALYAEREVLPKNKKLPPDPLFQQAEVRPRRAVGFRAQAVLPDEDVGSEGLIAQLITELTREYPDRFVNHAGPDLLRKPNRKKKKDSQEQLMIRKFVLVTDIIGSGNRAWRYLESAWRVSSIKALWSMQNSIKFEVVAFASTMRGEHLVRSHQVRPVLRTVCECPTIDSEFETDKANEIKNLCFRYNPSRNPDWALGYENTGALIAFAHGVPNNTPSILWKDLGTRPSLFSQRVTAWSRDLFGSVYDIDGVNQRLVAMRHKRLSPDIDWSGAPQGAFERYLVLAALSHRPRTVAVAARRSGLTLLEVEKVVAEARQFRWIDEKYRLTDAGHAQLIAAKRMRPKISVSDAAVMYYPTALRTPTNFF